MTPARAKVGFVMMCHAELDRAAELARFLAGQGAPVVIHLDLRVKADARRGVEATLADLPNVSFCRRFACDWGTWGLVAAAQAGAEQMLARHPEVSHVFLASGSCLPLRPLAELEAWLAARPGTDFIESVTIADVVWTISGIEEERFTLRFPFSWKRRRWLFDQYVDLQRRWKLRREIPEGLYPHLGSQWWCLTRQTLSAILSDPKRARYDRYFRRVWIPDESYFQTLARLHSPRIESRSLTLSKFDSEGRPHVFHDDHARLLRRSECFVARKIWPRADGLYRAFLAPVPRPLSIAEPNPARIDRLFALAAERRRRGRPGLYMQSRFPLQDQENGKTSTPYSIFQGFSDIFENFDAWLAKHAGIPVHGHIFAPGRVEFAGGETLAAGCLTDSALLRDYNPRAFLANLIWNGRGSRQGFMFSPRDNQDCNWFTATDPNAQISVVTGAWAVRLFRSGAPFAEQRAEAARLQRIETDQLGILRSVYVKARVRIWNLTEFVEAPMEPLHALLDEINPRAHRRLPDVPRMVDLTGFGRFLQDLRNDGMQPRLTGDFPLDDAWPEASDVARASFPR